MWYKGVSFTSEKCALIYLVDQAGTRTTTDYFSDLDYDFSQDILFQGARYGTYAVEDCCRMLNVNRQNFISVQLFSVTSNFYNVDSYIPQNRDWHRCLADWNNKDLPK